MTKFTKEQQRAVDESGTNIIVSAGAGSGKTTVLTARVIEHIKKGIRINELLILTFTNAAAGEMKDRIRKELSSIPELKSDLQMLESSYITTFDSYTLSLVKKYHYLINVSKDLNIIDNSLFTVIKNNIIDKIFDEFYLSNDNSFNKLINNFCIKNDNSIKGYISKIIDKIDLISDKDNYLNNFINTYYNDDKISSYLNEYMTIINDEIDNIKNNINDISYSDYNDYYINLLNTFDKLFNTTNYDDIKVIINSISIPRRPSKSDDIKEYKDNIDKSIKNIVSYTRFDSINKIKEYLYESIDYVKVLIEIIKKYYIYMNEYKNKNDIYSFTDIEIMAINILKNNKNICEEVKNSFKEILVDEYQDTSDLQEEFINLIGNNNVYMVGDIKQSIYGFRNANPSIFKNKYDNYKNNNGGIKIDLLDNFRSREEVVNNINEIFNLIMDDYLGNADYKNEQQMIYGNKTYLENIYDSNYNMEILNYDSKNTIYNNEEIEAFIVGKDIINKVNSKYQVFDKDSKCLRNIKYSDFCLITDRNTNFTIYHKIFDYLNIPVHIYEDKKLKESIDINLINNIISLILKIYDKKLDEDFKFYYMSIARSHLIEMNDNELFNIIKDNNYKNTSIYEKCLLISNNITKLSSYEIINMIINEFNYYDNIIKVGNINDNIIRLNNLLNISKNLSSIGYDIRMFNDYLTEMLESDIDIKYKGMNSNLDNVKIMNIHKSKGLEFPICYFLGLYDKFNNSDIKDRILYSKDHGIITPYYDEGIDNTILFDIYKEKYLLNDISEKIRLLYVALTRSKEKIIILGNINDIEINNTQVVSNNIRSKYNSLLDIFNSINGNLSKYIKNINLEDYNITKDYLNNKSINNIDLKINKNIIINNINIDNKVIDYNHASKTINKLISKNESIILEKGTNIHEYLEYSDLLHDNNELVTIIRNKFNINEETKIFKEHEFIYTKDDIEYHGIIDLLLINKDIIYIVDYKLSNIDDIKYIDQLKIYYDYISSIYNIPIECFLFSINNKEIKKLY